MEQLVFHIVLVLVEQLTKVVVVVMIPFRMVATVKALILVLLIIERLQVAEAVDQEVNGVMVLVDRVDRVIYLEQQEELLLQHLLLSGVNLDKVV